MKARWIVLGLAGLILVGAWASVAITYFFFDPTIVVGAASFVTMIFRTAVAAPFIAVMNTVPGAWPVTRPSALTVASAGLLVL